MWPSPRPCLNMTRYHSDSKMLTGVMSNFIRGFRVAIINRYSSPLLSGGGGILLENLWVELIFSYQVELCFLEHCCCHEEEWIETSCSLPLLVYGSRIQVCLKGGGG